MAKTTLKSNVNEWLHMTIYGYINGIIDDNYELMTRDGWINYLMICLDMDAKSGQMVNGLEFKHIYFYGKENIKKLAIEFLKRDDVKQYVLN